MVLFEIIQKCKGHLLNELRVSFKVSFLYGREPSRKLSHLNDSTFMRRVSYNIAQALLYKNVYIILVYGMKTFSGTPTGAVYYISLKLCV